MKVSYKKDHITIRSSDRILIINFRSKHNLCKQKLYFFYLIPKNPCPHMIRDTVFDSFYESF